MAHYSFALVRRKPRGLQRKVITGNMDHTIVEECWLRRSFDFGFAGQLWNMHDCFKLVYSYKKCQMFANLNHIQPIQFQNLTSPWLFS